MTKHLAITYSICLLAGVGVVGAGSAYAQQTIGPCSVLPANNIWNTPVDTLPVLSNSPSMVTTIGANTGFHADFGAGMWDGGPIGIPFITVRGTQTKYPATFYYADQSDAGPYAIPLTAPIEGGNTSTGDRHTIAVDTDNCIVYELYNAYPQSSSWNADAGAIFDLKSNALRPATWTSTDAAGLPIMPGLVTFEEVQSGEIKHAIRFTAPRTRHEFVWPARHYASALVGTQYPRMGERFRLKAGFNISSYPADVQVILRAMKKYGVMLADNGSAWYISGKPDARWDDDHLHTLGQLLGSNFEAVDATVIIIDPNSGAALQSGGGGTVGPPSVPARSDISVYRPSTGTWFTLNSSTNFTTSSNRVFGLSTDTIVPGDYDGDGKIDPAVYRPSTGNWFMLKSSTNDTASLNVALGLSTDIPVPGDYDGDGKTDPAVYRPSTGTWFILKSSTNYTTGMSMAFGLSTDTPLPADYDGDGKADPAVFRPSTGAWFMLLSRTNYTSSMNVSWGLSTDIPVPADYDGDGKADPAVFRPLTGEWFLLKSSTNYTTSRNVSWGLSTDVPVPADYDGDGKAEPGIYRPSTGTWFLLKSSTNYTSSAIFAFGLSTDTPINKRP